MLKTELRKIEARKKEREKKTADLQKMIAQADASQNENKKINKKQKIVVGRVNRQESTQPDTGTGKQQCSNESKIAKCNTEGSITRTTM